MTRRRAAGALSEPLLATDATAPVPATGSASSGTFSLALNNADSTSGLAAVDNAALVASESFGSSDSKPHTPRAPAQNGAKMADDGDADELTGELIRSSSGQDETNDEDTSDVVDDAFFKSEHLALLHLAAPTAVMYLSRLGMAFTDIAILGSLSTDYLAGAAIGNMWMNLTSTFCDRGVAAAFAVLAGQAYGAGNKRLVGLYAQQALVVAIVLAIPITALWSVAYPALRFLGVGEDEATLAAEFARWSLARPLPLNVYLILQRWLQVQQNTIPAMVINAAFVGVNYGLNILLIHGFSSRGHWYYVPALGFKGSPIATSITQALVTLTLIIYVLISGACADSWPGWRLGRALQPQRFKRYLAQVAPLGLGACFEEWQLETVSLLATRLGKVSVATHNATLSLFVFSSSFMYGIIAAVSVRVARHLGAGAARRARAASRYAVRAALCIGVIVAAVFILGRNAIPRIFSSDPDVWREAAPVQFLAGACYIGMAIFYTNVGTLSGQGRSIIVAGAFLGGAWLVGVPAAWAFANPVKLKLLGLWIGLVFGYVVVTAVTTVFVLRTKWHAVAVRAREQAEVKRAPAFSSGEEGGAAGEDMGSVEGSMDQRGAENSNSLSLRMTPEGTGNEHRGGSTGAPDIDDTV